MINVLGIVGYIILIFWGIGLFICIANIVSHIVRRHVLWDRQQDLVRKINWNIKQHADETEIESLKYEERDVFNTMALHKRMILLNIVNIVIMLFLAVVIAVLMNVYIFKGIV